MIEYKKYLDELMKDEDAQLNKLQAIVAKSLEEKNLIVKEMEPDDSSKLTFPQRISDKVASFGGSWRFIIWFLLFMFAWIVFNVIAIGKLKYDPFPFILLNLILSCVASLQAPIIMMSQNRKEERDRKRAQNDYIINLKAEIEIRNLHDKLDLLMVDQMQKLFDVQKRQLELLNELLKKGN